MRSARGSSSDIGCLHSLGFPSPRDHRILLVLVSVFWSSSSLMLVGDLELPGRVESVPPHGKRVGTRWSLKSLQTQTVIP